jgi:hypothetical protein
MGILIAFAPWIVFWIVSGFEGFELGTIAALGTSLLVVMPDALHRKVKILDAGSLIAFALLAALGLTPVGDFVAEYVSPLSNAALTLIVVVSMVVRQPFVLQYAREGRPPELWNDPRFLHVCWLITWVWLGAFVIQTVSSVLAVWLPAQRPVLRFVLPYGATVTAAVFTRWYPNHLAAQARRRGALAGESDIVVRP